MLLAVALLAAVIVAAALLEDDDLVGLGLGDDLGRDGEAVGGRSSRALAGEQDVAQLMVSPASPASFSTTILSPAATRYCLPPVRTTANMALSKLQMLSAQLVGRGRTPAREPGCYRSGPDVNRPS